MIEMENNNKKEFWKLYGVQASFVFVNCFSWGLFVLYLVESMGFGYMEYLIYLFLCFFASSLFVALMGRKIVDANKSMAKELFFSCFWRYRWWSISSSGRFSCIS
jgi:hypothetical protein